MLGQIKAIVEGDKLLGEIQRLGLKYKGGVYLDGKGKEYKWNGGSFIRIPKEKKGIPASGISMDYRYPASWFHATRFL